MPITNHDGLLESWATELEMIEQRLEELYGAPSVTPTLPQITDHNGMLELIAELSEKSTWNFAKVFNGLTVVSNNSYTVTVPDAAMYNVANILKVGGKTVSVNNALSNSVVSKIVSNDGDGQAIETITVPAEVKAIVGYGWSAGEAYNYIDFKNKKFVQTVGEVVLDGTQTVTYTSINTSRCRMGFAVDNVEPFTSVDVVDPKIVSSYLDPISNNAAYSSGARGIHRRTNGASDIIVNLGKSSGITTDASFLAYLAANPLTVHYALATPIETDISAYLTSGDISVEPGGTITFTNQYQRAVPSEVGYVE